MKFFLLSTFIMASLAFTVQAQQDQNTQITEVHERQRESQESEKRLHGRQEQQDEYSDAEDFREDQLQEDANFIEEDFDN